MADETINNVPVAEAPKEASRAEERISQLSEKTRLAEEAREAAEKNAAEALKKAQFAEGYADFIAVNPAAKEFKQQIHEKFLAGVPVEDAAYAVLGKAGKLGASAPIPEPAQPAGGSASTTVTAEVKTPQQMSQEEKRAILEKEMIWS